jgi:prepilin-type N-terminal cleavage/methylation domain-containing protein
MRHYRGPWRRREGFSLGEMLVAMVIGAMILTAVLSIYNRANRAADAVLAKIESPSLATEVLQLIAEDLGRTLGGEGVTIQIRNGFDNRFARAELVLRRTFQDKEDKDQMLEEIIWRAAYDHEGETPGLILYRSYGGVTQEDKLLDDNRASWEKNYPFVPICRGVTFFQLQACQGDELVEQWSAPALPVGVKITLSFAEPYETVRGTYDVVDEEKVSRTMALDATRTIKFVLAAGSEPNENQDVNQQVPNEQSRNERGPDEPMPNRQMPRGQTPRGQTPRETRPR